MGCFVVSTIAAVGVGAAKYVVKHKEKKNPKKEETKYKFGSSVKWSTKLAYLEFALWAGSFILAGEHVIHGEIHPYPPFFTAVEEGPEATMEMLHEIGTVGVCMMLAIVMVWGLGVFLYDLMKYKKHYANKTLEVEAK